MKSVIKAVIAVAVISTPLFAMGAALEDQKHESGIMLDGMGAQKSAKLMDMVNAQTAPAAAVEAAAAKEVKTEPAAPAVAREQSALKAAKLNLKADVAAPANDLEKQQRRQEIKDGIVGGIKTAAVLGGLVALTIACPVAGAVVIGLALGYLATVAYIATAFWRNS